VSVAEDRLQRVQAALKSGRELAPDDRDFLLSIAPESVPLPPGASAAALGETRQLIADFARAFPMNSLRMYERLSRYEGTAWPRERLFDACPAPRKGRPEEFCWRILRAFGRSPSARMIREILREDSVAASRGRASAATP
jgi:hypothetical protein